METNLQKCAIRREVQSKHSGGGERGEEQGRGLGSRRVLGGGCPGEEKGVDLCPAVRS